MLNKMNGGGYASGPIPPYKIKRGTKTVKIKVCRPKDPTVDIVPVLVNNADDIIVNPPEDEKSGHIIGGGDSGHIIGSGVPEHIIDDGNSAHIDDDNISPKKEDDDKDKKRLGIPIILGVLARTWCIIIN